MIKGIYGLWCHQRGHQQPFTLLAKPSPVGFECTSSQCPGDIQSRGRRRFFPNHSSSTASTDADGSLNDAPHTSSDLERNRLTTIYHHRWRTLQSHRGNEGGGGANATGKACLQLETTLLVFFFYFPIFFLLMIGHHRT